MNSACVNARYPKRRERSLLLAPRCEKRENLGRDMYLLSATLNRHSLVVNGAPSALSSRPGHLGSRAGALDLIVTVALSAMAARGLRHTARSQ